MNIALPDSLNFERQIPLDGSCSQQEVTTVPITGVNEYTPGSYFIINIPRTAPNCVLDANNSFLRFRLKNTNAAGGASLTLNNSCDCIFQRLEVMYAGNVIECIDDYSVLSNLLLDICVEPHYRSTTLNMLKGCNTTSNLPYGETISPASSRFYSTTLISGVVGSLARSYIPIFALSGPIQIKLTLHSNKMAFKWSADNPSDYKIDQIEFHSNTIRLSDQVMSMISTPDNRYTLYSESYSNYNAIVAASTTSLEQLIPCRYSSLKTVLLAMRLQTNSNNNTHQQFPQARSAMGLVDFAYRLGSLVMPPQRVKGNDVSYVECFEQLKKSFHFGGNTLATVGMMRFDNYTDSTTNASGCTDLSNSKGMHCLGIDMEVYSSKSGQILSGVNCTGNDLYFSATFLSTGIPSIAQFDFFLHHDTIYQIQDGVLMVNV